MNAKNPTIAATVPSGRLAHSVIEAAALLGISRTSVYTLLTSGALRSVRVAGRRLIPRAAIEELLNKAAS